MGEALGHGVLPGVAVAILLGISGMLGAAVAAAVMIAGVSWITRRTLLSSTTAIGLLFVGMLALGVVIVSRSATFTGDLTRILFGDILGTSWGDIWIQLGVTVSVVALAVVCARPFLMLCFDAEQAKVAGFDPRLYEGVMLGMIAATVVVSFQSVGTLLVLGMLLAPAGTAALVTSRIPTAMVLAGSIGSASVAAGLLLSYHFDLAAGAAIVLVAIVAFFAVLVVRTATASSSGVERRSMSAVRLRGLAAGYGDPPVVDGLELELPPGATLALVGTNGSGKSTILRTLAGLLDPRSGTVEVLGGRPGRSPEKLAYLAQFHVNGLLLPIRAREIVSMGRFAGKGLLGRMGTDDRAAVREALERMGVLDLANQPLRDLSGGQQQRVFVAQALARQADLLLLDEPAAGLDAAGQDLLAAALAAERDRGATVVVATHDIGGCHACRPRAPARAPRGGARPALGRPHARGAAGDVRPRAANACRWRPRDGFGTRPRRTRPRGRPPPLTPRQVVPDGGAPAGVYGALRRRIKPESARKARPPTARPARTGTVAATGSVTSRRSPQARAASVVATAT